MTTTASVMIRESNRKGDSGSTSKNVGSFVKINSISIDLEDTVNEKSYVDQCDHFSIRGYVSEVRRKNWKLCWPFSLDDEQKTSDEQKLMLPPLTSHKFRWWSCQSCLQEVGCRDHDHETRLNNGSIGSKPKSDCSQIPSLCTAALPLPGVQLAPETSIAEKRKSAMPLADVQLAPETSIVEKRKSDAHTSDDISIKNMKQDKKEAVVAEACNTFIGPENDADNHGHERPRVTFGPVEINLNVMEEKSENGTAVTESVKLDGSRPVDLRKDTRGKNDGYDSELAAPSDPCKTSKKICITENPNSVVGQLEELNIASGSSVLACLDDGAANAFKSQTDKNVSRVLDERDRVSSESVEVVGNSLHSSSSGLQGRKTRKVRLLTELLGNNGDAKTEQISTEVSPSNAATSEPAGVGMCYVPQRQVSLRENNREELSDNKKRKLPQDEESKFPETCSHVNLNKKVKNCKGSEEIANAMKEPELKGASSAGLYVQNGSKSHWNKIGTDSIPITEKKKSKKNQTIDACSYLVPVGDGLPNQFRDEVRFPSKGKVEDGISFRAVNDASSSRGMEKNPLAASRKEKKPTLSKNKSKMHQADDGQSSHYPWSSSLLQKGPSVRGKEIMQTGPLNVSFRQADSAIDTGLQLSLGSYVAPKKCSSRYNHQVGDGASKLSWQEGTPVDETVRKNVETNYISNSAGPSKSGSYAVLKKRVHGELSGKLDPYNMPVLSEKQKNNSQIEEGCRSLGKQVDISGASKFQKTNKGKGHSAVPRKHGHKIANNVADQGAIDDIPMEIVELMAQIQYERRQENSENNKILFKTANDGRNCQMLDYDKAYSAEKFRISEEASKRTNSQVTNGRNSNSTARKNVQSSKQKTVDYFPNSTVDHSSNSHLGQKKPSSSDQLPDASSSQCSCARNCKWNVNMVGHGFFNPGGIQKGSCATCPIAPRPTEEAAQVWPSGLPLHKSARYNGPQNGASHRSNLHMLPNAPGLLVKGDTSNREHELKYLKLGAASPQIGSETLGRRNTERSFSNKHNGIEHQQNPRGSLDLYSNETIPAMHLLSLMDAGMPSGSTFNTGGNTKYLKRGYPTDNSSEYSQMPIGIYSKSRAAVKHPLDYHGKHQLPVKPHDFFPVNPISAPSTSSFRHEKGFERANDFMGPVSFSSRGKEKVEKSSSAPANRGRKALSSPFSTAGFVPNHNSTVVHSMQKTFLGSSSSMVFPLQTRAPENSTELKLETPNYAGTFRPPKSRPESLICSINRNPADFSIPGAGNEYMIRGEDLKVRKQRRRTSLTAADQRKRQRNTKHATQNVQA